jgi:hypothetical protein
MLYYHVYPGYANYHHDYSHIMDPTKYNHHTNYEYNADSTNWDINETYQPQLSEYEGDKVQELKELIHNGDGMDWERKARYMSTGSSSTGLNTTWRPATWNMAQRTTTQNTNP